MVFAWRWSLEGGINQRFNPDVNLFHFHCFQLPSATVVTADHDDDLIHICISIF